MIENIAGMFKELPPVDEHSALYRANLLDRESWENIKDQLPPKTWSPLTEKEQLSLHPYPGIIYKEDLEDPKNIVVMILHHRADSNMDIAKVISDVLKNHVKSSKMHL